MITTKLVNNDGETKLYHVFHNDQQIKGLEITKDAHQSYYTIWWDICEGGKKTLRECREFIGNALGDKDIKPQKVFVEYLKDFYGGTGCIRDNKRNGYARLTCYTAQGIKYHDRLYKSHELAKRAWNRM